MEEQIKLSSISYHKMINNLAVKQVKYSYASHACR